MSRIPVGLVGARGYVGRELCKMLARHPRFSLGFVVSSTQAGRPVGEHLAGAADGLVFEDLDADAIAARGAAAVVLALPNEHAAPYVAAIDRLRRETVIVDVSADHRFDDAWAYGLPEINRDRLRGATRIANPGCYATAAALVVDPITRQFDHPPAHAFGVSGYSGAGATPSPRNDAEALRDNLMPYALVDHVHEREVTHHCGPVHLMPHVAPFFRGITMTVSIDLPAPITRHDLESVYATTYVDEPLLHITDEIPLVRDAANRPHATIGGFAVSSSNAHVVVICTLDNLLKGAASQAVQNLNLAFGLPELSGIYPWPA